VQSKSACGLGRTRTVPGVLLTQTRRWALLVAPICYRTKRYETIIFAGVDKVSLPTNRCQVSNHGLAGQTSIMLKSRPAPPRAYPQAQHAVWRPMPLYTELRFLRDTCPAPDTEQGRRSKVMEQLMVEGLSNVQAGVIAMTSAEIYSNWQLSTSTRRKPTRATLCRAAAHITPPMKSVSCQTPTGQPEEPNWPHSKTKTHHCVTTKHYSLAPPHTAAGRGKPV
jgi:hypothetical protein